MSAKMPDCPRPTTKAELAEKSYLVRDRATGGAPKVWQSGLTYDEAWKLKQKLAGERKSITVRVEHMAKFAEHTARAKLSGGQASTPSAKAPAPKTYSLDEANASALAAARGAIATPVVAPAPQAPPVDDLFSDDEVDELTANDDLDALIDDANAEQDSDAPSV